MRAATCLTVLQFLCLAAGGALSAISCYNDQGTAVDWLYLYKLPRPSQSPPEEGMRYLLLQPGGGAWTQGAGLVNDSGEALGRTVGQLYKLGQEEDVAYILYNDQTPPSHGEREKNECGHTKGVVLLDKTQGFWLVHSTPHFPPRQEVGTFSYPETGVENGQNFLCVTFPVERFQSIGEQLQLNQPLVYDCSVPPALASVLPALNQLCRKDRAPPPPPRSLAERDNRSASLLSLGGASFTSFAKSASFGDDLYVSWVAPSLQSDLLVQFWRRSAGVLPSNCSLSQRVLNVQRIGPGGGGGGVEPFKSTQDHSKWAVSVEGQGQPGEGGGWVCVGDINRNLAEERRGGGTVCVQEVEVWKAYRTAVLEFEDC
ncbi:deoxyribonuclease-2-alpha [Amia ocellicauda]|uniref:deoxyribonuclease-2-alpha n=1 Tax=Amia ocellicauda TaxID=2972642 RepID=UPI003464374C